AGLDAAAVGVTAVGECGCVAPVALDFPALPADGYVPTESPRTLVGVLVALLVVPGVELRIGQHLAQLVARDVCERGKPLAVAEARSLRIAARIAVEVEEEPELDPFAVDRARAVPGAVARAAARLVRVDGVVGVRHRVVLRHLCDLCQYLARRG